MYIPQARDKTLQVATRSEYCARLFKSNSPLRKLLLSLLLLLVVVVVVVVDDDDDGVGGRITVLFLSIIVSAITLTSVYSGTAAAANFAANTCIGRFTHNKDS